MNVNDKKQKDLDTKMAKKRKFEFSVTPDASVFGDSKRAAKTPADVADVLFRAYARHTTGGKVTGVKGLSGPNPLKYKDVKNQDVSLSVLFGEQAATASIQPSLSKLRSGNKTDLKNVVGGLREVRRILRTNKEIQPILKRAYADTVMLKLRQRWEAKGGDDLGRQTVTTAGGTGARGSGVEPAGGAGLAQDLTIQTRLLQDRSFVTARTAEFKSAGLRIGRFLTDPSQLVVQGKFVGLRSLRDFMDLEVESSPSPFRSVFLMLEFGTGRFAKPKSFVRRYAGTRKTKYKVPPIVASTVGADTASWFNIGRAAALARRDQEDGVISEFPYRSMALPGRRPRNIIFEQRGIARTLSVAKKKALIETIRLINLKVASKFPGWGALTVRKINVPIETSLTLVI